MLRTALICAVLPLVVSRPLGGAVITILLPSPDPNPQIDCNRGRVVVEVGLDRTTTVNGKTIKESDIPGRLEEIFQRKQARLIYFSADPRLQFKAVASVLERCNSVPNLTIALVTTSSIQKDQCVALPVRRPMP